MQFQVLDRVPEFEQDFPAPGGVPAPAQPTRCEEANGAEDAYSQQGTVKEKARRDADGARRQPHRGHSAAQWSRSTGQALRQRPEPGASPGRRVSQRRQVGAPRRHRVSSQADRDSNAGIQQSGGHGCILLYGPTQAGMGCAPLPRSKRDTRLPGGLEAIWTRRCEE